MMRSEGGLLSDSCGWEDPSVRGATGMKATERERLVIQFHRPLLEPGQ